MMEIQVIRNDVGEGYEYEFLVRGIAMARISRDPQTGRRKIEMDAAGDKIRAMVFAFVDYLS